MVTLKTCLDAPSAKITLQDTAAQADLRVEDLNCEVSSQCIFKLSEFCVHWKLIGRRLSLTNAEIAAVDDHNTTEEEKRVGMLVKWKGRFAFKATCRMLIETILVC